MSMTQQAAGSLRSIDNFTSIIQGALSEYDKVTGEHLATHPLATQFDGCDSPQAVLTILRTQAHAFRKVRNNDEKLMGWLDPIVHILSKFSSTLEEGIGLKFPPATAIFSGINVLLAAARDVVANHNKLLDLFERIHLFLQRLNSYTGVPLTEGFTELLGKIMAQTLSILALSTMAMTERRMKKFLNKQIAGRNVEDGLLLLDSLTKEESIMAEAKNLEVTQHDDCKLEEVGGLAEGADHNVDQTVKAVEGIEMDQHRQNRTQKELRTWLSPPDPSVKHQNACETQHDGSAMWFIQGSKFQEWKVEGSLLWILGNPGAGKSVLCSAIIEDIKNLREERPLLVTYHYFDFNNASKSHVHGLLASLLSQLSQDSSLCQDVLYQLFKKCRDGSERPSLAGLVDCLKNMLRLPGQLPIFVIIDALDECPHTTGTPSAREEVLNFVKDLVQSSHSNLFICVTSRPEQDIWTVLNPLTSESRRVAVHEESGQREDINNFVRSFVRTDRAMKRWKEEDKELIINMLSERASGMFRWAYCQLDALRRCFPSSIRKALDDLPATLDETYERTLKGIPKQERQHAHRLFQWLLAAIRPLRVEELGEVYAIEFDQASKANYMEGWRPEDAEEVILSACSTLITITDDKGSKIVQFSHSSVKEFLTSERLQTSEVGNIRNFHISLDAAHTVLTRACLAALLQLDENIDKDRLRKLPLTFYAAQNWLVHANHEDVGSRVQDVVHQLFDPTKLYLAAWIWIYDVELGWIRHIDALPDRPPNPDATALYYAVTCGLCGPAKYLISTHDEDVNAKCGSYGSALHTASMKGHLDAVSLLLDHGADVNIRNKWEETPLCAAYAGRHVDVMRHLLMRGATMDMQYNSIGRIIHNASWDGQAEVIGLLLQKDDDVNATGWSNQTPLHWASIQGNVNIVQTLLDHGANINAVSDRGTSLYHASVFGRLEVTRVLLKHGADVHIQEPVHGTPLQMATKTGRIEIAQLLLEYGAD